jgi:tetratricopeptide (TPR) repeat protein
MISYQIKVATFLMTALAVASCRTLETGGKIVDKGRNEVVISSAGNQQTAMPDGRKDTSITAARERLEAMVKEKPKDVPALLGLAQLQLAQDRFADAEATSRRVLLLDVKNQEARKVLAQISIRTENYDMALIFLTALGGEASTDSSVHNMLGLIALANGDNGEAMRIWKNSLNLNAGDISVRMNMGVLYLKYRLLSQARAQFERILKVAPNHQDAQLHLAIIDASRGKNVEAMTTYQAILAKDDSNQLALFNMAVAQKNLNLYDDAVATMKRYIKVSPEKSSKTDQAFAMIDEINSNRAAKGEKISDEDLQSLAQELSTRKSHLKADQSKGTLAAANAADSAPAGKAEVAPAKAVTGAKASPKAKPATVQNAAPVAPEKVKEASVSDSEIDALERQLKAPAH